MLRLARLLLSTVTAAAVTVTPTFGQDAIRSPAEGAACEPIGATPTALDPGGWWASDRTIRVEVSSPDGGAAQDVRIVGDIIDLTPSNFPSLVRLGGQSLTNIRSLTIEGRLVRIDMPIRLQGGSLSILGERVEIGINGSIQFLAMPDEQLSAVGITAAVLDLSQSSNTPFHFTLYEPTSDQRFGQQLHLVVGELLTAHPYETTPAAYIVARTLNGALPMRAIQRRGFEPILPPGSSVLVGRDAEAAYSTALSTAAWPLQSALKLARLFQRGPYDSAVVEFVRDQLSIQAARQQGVDDPLVGHILSRLEIALQLQTDLQGLAATDVPMTNLPERLERAKALLDDLLGAGEDEGLLQAWQRLGAVQISGPDNVLIGELETRFDELVASRTALRREADNLDLSLQHLNEDISSRTDSAGQIQPALADRARTRAEQSQNVQAAMRDIQTAAVVVATVFPATAPFALAAGAAGALGTYVQNERNAGTLGATEFFGTAAELAGRYRTYSEQLAAFRANWSASEQNFSSAVDFVRGRSEDRTGYNNFTKAVGGYVGAVQQMWRTSQSPMPASISAPSGGNSVDDTLRTDLAATLAPVERMRVEEQEARSRLLSIATEVADIEAQIVQVGIALDTAQSYDPSNDEARLRLRDAAAWIESSMVAELSSQIVLLERSLLYLTGRRPTLPPSLQFFAQDLGISNEADQLGLALDGGERLTVNGPDLREIEAELRLVVRQIESAANAASDEIGVVTPRTPLFSAQSADTAGNPDLTATAIAHAQFLSLVNASIAGQIENREQAEALSRVPIAIPFDPTDGTWSVPELLLGVIVEGVELSSESAQFDSRSIEFIVSSVRFGTVRLGSNCFAVRDASVFADGTPAGQFGDVSAVRWSTTLPQPEPINFHTVLETWDNFSQLSARAFPAQSSYFLQVIVQDPELWSEPPAVEQLNIRFVTSGPNIK